MQSMPVCLLVVTCLSCICFQAANGALLKVIPKILEVTCGGRTCSDKEAQKICEGTMHVLWTKGCDLAVSLHMDGKQIGRYEGPSDMQKVYFTEPKHVPMLQVVEGSPPLEMEIRYMDTDMMDKDDILCRSKLYVDQNQVSDDIPVRNKVPCPLKHGVVLYFTVAFEKIA